MAENEKKISNPYFDEMNYPGYSKLRLVTALIMTGSFVSVEDFKGILPEEQYKQLELAMQADTERYLSNFDLAKYPKEVVEEQRKSRNNRELILRQGQERKAELQDIIYMEGDFSFTLDPEQMNELELAKLVEKAMEKHLSYNVFHSNPFLSKEQLQEALRYYIDVAREIQGKEPKYQGQEKQVEKTEEEKPKERAGEEQEIEAMLAQKRELEAKITELDSKIAEARAKEAQLKGGQEQTGKPEQEDEGR